MRVRYGIAVTTAAGVALMAATLSGQAAGGGMPPPVVPKSLVDSGEPVRSCESLASLALPDTTIVSALVDQGNGTVPASCRVTATVVHPPAPDPITIWIGLPMKAWNGRFQGVGGGGFSGGSPNGIAQPLRSGYAAGSTDTGHPGASGSFALDANGRLNWQRIRANAYLGIHDMTVVGKALTQAFYGTGPRRAYFNGCSTGGRQGLSEAQRYPSDYDGILSGEPAINWSKLHPEQKWGSLLMLETRNPIPSCKYAAATAAAVAACDADDGVTDGVIGNPHACKYDPGALVGTQAGSCGAFTEADASILRRIWEGPRRTDGSFLWYGMQRGGDFGGLSGTRGTPPAPAPNPITLEWFRYFLKQDPEWDFTTITRPEYEQLFVQSVEQFTDVLSTDNPDLSAFRDRGGRIVMWHGWSDPLIYPDGSIDYVRRVQEAMGGPAKTAEFLRLFMAAGVGHCGGGTGAAPSGQFEAMVRWVEEGDAPETLDGVKRDQAGAVVRTRPLCQYPLVARYKGTGSTDEASSFECTR
jgi:feruloyl esterase